MDTKNNIHFVLKRSRFGAFRQSMEYFNRYDDQSSEIYLNDLTFDIRRTASIGNKRSYDEVDCGLSLDQNDFTLSNEVILVGFDSNLPVDLRRKLAAITKTVEVFSEQHECLKFIATCTVKSVFLVWMDIWSQEVESQISNYHQIICTYALQQQPSSFQFPWKETYEKEKNVGPVAIFGSHISMLEQVTQDVSLWQSNQTSWSFISMESLQQEGQSSQDVSTDYLWYRVLTDVVVSIPPESNDPYSEMMDVYKSICENQRNQVQLEIVDRFVKTYNVESALWWYSRETFLFHALNRALRTGNIPIILKFRIIIQDIHRQLKDLQPSYPYKPVMLYRGQLIASVELNKLRNSVGKVISFYGFTSTTRDMNIAIAFSGDGAARPRLESVIYEIEIPKEDTSQCVYADITHISQITNEYETLFSFNSTFRVVGIEEKTNYTFVKLIVTNDNNELSQLVEGYAVPSVSNNRDDDNLFGSGNELILANRFSDKGDYEQALLCYRISQDFYLSEDDLAMLHNNCGWLFERRGDYNTALEEYHKALNYDKKLLDQNLHRQAIIYSNIGLIYYELENLGAAKFNLKNSLKLKREATDPVAEPSSIAKTLNSLALIDHRLGEYDPALLIYNEALQELNKSKKNTKLLKATLLNNIGFINLGKNDYSSAIENFEEVQQIRKEFLPTTHPDIAWSSVQIGLVFERIGDYFQANEHYNDAINIQTKHSDLVKTYTRQDSIQNMYSLTIEACELYEKALKILNRMFPYKKADIAAIYNNRGLVYKQQNDIVRAQKNFEMALKLFLECRHLNHPCLRKIYGNLADLQYSEQNYEQALVNYNKAIEIGRKTLSDDDPELKSYQELAVLVRLHIPNGPPQSILLIKDIRNNYPLVFIGIALILIYCLVATIVLLGKLF